MGRTSEWSLEDVRWVGWLKGLNARPRERANRDAAEKGSPRERRLAASALDARREGSIPGLVDGPSAWDRIIGSDGTEIHLL